MNKLRIGIVSPFNPYELRTFIEEPHDVLNNNCAASSVHALVQGLIKLGYKTVVFTYDNTIKNIHEYHGNLLDIYVVPIPKLIKAVKGKSILINLLMGEILAKEIGKHLKEIDVIHAQWTYEYAHACIPFAKTKPVFCTVRDWCPYILSQIHDFKDHLMWYSKLILFNKVIRCKDIHFIANSKYTHSCLISKHIPCEPLILPNPIKEDFILKERTSYPSLPVFISIAQNLSESRKNIMTLLLAFKEVRKKLPLSQLLLIGTYDSTKFSIYKKKDLITNVTFYGSISHDKIKELLDKSSILIHPSLEETFGNVLLEGMARRIPVIGGFKSGAVPAVLGYGKYGLLCDVQNPIALENTMINLVENKRLQSQIINASTKYLLDNYLDSKIAERHITCYKKYLFFHSHY